MGLLIWAYRHLVTDTGIAPLVDTCCKGKDKLKSLTGISVKHTFLM